MLLERFYQKPKEYAFAFQLYMLTGRCHQLDSARMIASDGRLVTLDRCPVGDAVFGSILLQHTYFADPQAR